ncbi:hypothetical protein LWI29_021432 [Acer saccharum]|uniref:Uncharacterized protein n=1 Tax=Acer saccharum TaxID=4024 RepID=A0AA39VRL1_ACESA|nr:hypothetical protein LWI29_021432 [Acer saccharum]
MNDNEGVISATIKGDDKGQIEVTGVAIDIYNLLTKLRKKLKYADLLSVAPIEEKPPDKPITTAETPQPPPQPQPVGVRLPDYYVCVESVAWKGDDKNQIEVIGDGLDPAVLTLLLRKKLGYADLVSVEEKKDEKKEDEAKLQVTAMPAYSYYGSWPYCEATQVVRDPYYGSWS